MSEKTFPCPAGLEPDCGYPACAHAQQCEANDCSASACSSLDCANEMIRQQEYLLNRQAELNRAVIRRNVEIMKAGNQCARENHKLKKELEGYKRGRLWTMFTSFLPTVSFGDDRF